MTNPSTLPLIKVTNRHLREISAHVRVALIAAYTIPALGHPPPAMTEGGAEDEWRKRITAKFLLTAQNLALIEGNARTTLSMISGRALQAMHRRKAEKCLVVIDYLQRMAHQAGYQNLRESVGALTLQLREVSRRLASPILSVSSQSRQGYQQGKTNPFLETLKESGDIEYSADAVMILQEDDKRGTTPAARNLNLLIVKNRYGEAGMSVPLTFKPALGEFRETQ